MSNKINHPSSGEEVVLFHASRLENVNHPVVRITPQDILKSSSTATYEYIINGEGKLIIARQYTPSQVPLTREEIAALKAAWPDNYTGTVSCENGLIVIKNGTPTQRLVQVSHTMLSGGKPVAAAGQIHRIVNKGEVTQFVVNMRSDTYPVSGSVFVSGEVYLVEPTIEKVFKREGLGSIVIEEFRGGKISGPAPTIGKITLFSPSKAGSLAKTIGKAVANRTLLSSVTGMVELLSRSPLLDIFFSFDKTEDHPVHKSIQRGVLKWMMMAGIMIACERVRPGSSRYVMYTFFGREVLGTLPSLSDYIKRLPDSEELNKRLDQANLGKAEKIFLKSIFYTIKGVLIAIDNLKKGLDSINPQRIMDQKAQKKREEELKFHFNQFEQRVLALQALMEDNPAYFNAEGQETMATSQLLSLAKQLKVIYSQITKKLRLDDVIVNKERQSLTYVRPTSILESIAADGGRAPDFDEEERRAQPAVLAAFQNDPSEVQFLYDNGDTEFVKKEEDGSIFRIYLYRNGDIKLTKIDEDGQVKSTLVQKDGIIKHSESDGAEKELPPLSEAESIHFTPSYNNDEIPPLVDIDDTPLEIDSTDLAVPEKEEEKAEEELSNQGIVWAHHWTPPEPVKKPTFKELMQVTEVGIQEGVLGGQGLVLTLASGAEVSLFSLVPKELSPCTGHALATGVTVPLNGDILTALATGSLYCLPSTVLLLTMAYFINLPKNKIEKRLASDMQKAAKLENELQGTFEGFDAFLEAFRKGEIDSQSFITKANEIKERLLAADHQMGKSGRYAVNHENYGGEYFERQTAFRQAELDLASTVRAAMAEQEVNNNYALQVQNESFPVICDEVYNLASKRVLTYVEFLKFQAAFNELVARVQNEGEKAPHFLDALLIERLTTVPMPITLSPNPVAKPSHKTKNDLDLRDGKDETRVAKRVQHWADKVDYLYKEFCRLAESGASLEALERAGAAVLAQISRTRGSKENVSDECNVNLGKHRLQSHYKEFIQRIESQVNLTLERAKAAAGCTINPITPAILNAADVGKLQAYQCVQQFNQAHAILFDSSRPDEERQAAFNNYVEAAKNYFDAHEREVARTEAEIKALLSKTTLTVEESKKLAELKAVHIAALINLGRVDQIEKIAALPVPVILNPETAAVPSRLNRHLLILGPVGKKSATRQTYRAEAWAERVEQAYKQFCEEAANPNMNLQELERRGAVVQSLLAEGSRLHNYDLNKPVLNENGQESTTVYQYYHPFIAFVNGQVNSTLEAARNAQQPNAKSDAPPLVTNEEIETAKKQGEEEVKNRAPVEQAIKFSSDYGTFENFDAAYKRQMRMAQLSPHIEGFVTATNNFHMYSGSSNTGAKKDAKEEVKIGLEHAAKLEEMGLTEADILLFFPTSEEGREFWHFLQTTSVLFKALPDRKEIEKGLMTYVGRPSLALVQHGLHQIHRYNGFERTKRVVTVLDGLNAYFPAALPAITSMLCAAYGQKPSYVIQSYLNDLKGSLGQGSALGQVMALMSGAGQNFALTKPENCIRLLHLGNTLLQLDLQIVAFAIGKIYGTGTSKGASLMSRVHSISSVGNALVTTQSTLYNINAICNLAFDVIGGFSQVNSWQSFFKQGVTTLTRVEQSVPALSPVTYAFSLYQFLSTDHSGKGIRDQICRRIQSWVPVDLRGQLPESPYTYWLIDALNCALEIGAGSITGGRAFVSQALFDAAHLIIDTATGRHVDDALESAIKNFEYHGRAKKACEAQIAVCQDQEEIKKLSYRLVKLSEAMESSFQNLSKLLQGDYRVGDHERYVVERAKMFLFERTLKNLTNKAQKDRTKWVEAMQLVQISFKAEDKAVFTASHIDIFDAPHLVTDRFRLVSKMAKKDQEYALRQIPHELALLERVSRYLDRRISGLTEMERKSAKEFYDQEKNNLEFYKIKLIHQYSIYYCAPDCPLQSRSSALETVKLFDRLSAKNRFHITWMMLNKATQVLLGSYFKDLQSLQKNYKKLDKMSAEAAAMLLDVMTFCLENVVRQILSANLGEEGWPPAFEYLLNSTKQEFLFINKLRNKIVAHFNLKIGIVRSHNFYSQMKMAVDILEKPGIGFQPRKALPALSNPVVTNGLADDIQKAELKVEELKNQVQMMEWFEANFPKKLKKTGDRLNQLEGNVHDLKQLHTEKEVDGLVVGSLMDKIARVEKKVDKLIQRFKDQIELEREVELVRQALESIERQEAKRNPEKNKGKNRNWCHVQ